MASVPVESAAASGLASRRLGSRLRFWDLRFADALDEVAFKNCQEVYLLNPLIITCCVSMAGIATVWSGLYPAEVAKWDVAFHWQTDDPRSFHCAAYLIGLVSSLILLTLTALRKAGRLASWNWERITVSMAIYTLLLLFLMSSWHSAVVFGKLPDQVWLHETRSAENMTVMTSIAGVVWACNFMPIRAHILWMVPFSSFVMWLVVVIVFGSPFPNTAPRLVICVGIICFFCFWGARRHEQHRREKWLAEKRIQQKDTELEDTASLARAFHEVAGALCDIVLSLGPDFRVVCTDSSHDAFFGRPMNGVVFVDLLAEEHRSRFVNALKEVSDRQVLQSLPAVLELHFSTVQVQILLVNTRSRAQRYLVGLHSVEHKPMQEVEMFEPSLRKSSAHLRPIAEGEVASSMDDDLLSAAKSCYDSMGSTTHTGKVFAEVDGLCSEGEGEERSPSDDHVHARLQHIAEVGFREHWLIKHQEVEVLPDMVLGAGSFGLVVAAKLRGTVVAAKVPRRATANISLKHLASVANELRVYRRLRHNNIVLFYGAVVDPGSSELVLLYEMVQGLPLDQYFNKNTIEPYVRHKFLLDIICAIRYLHGLRPAIVHGDLKPSNILVESQGPKAKLADFGLARLLTKKAKPLGGTLHWAAPELLSRGSGSAPLPPTPSADMFSVGLIMHFVIFGKEARKLLKKPRGKVAENHRASLADSWPCIQSAAFSEECQSLSRECLYFDPASRLSAEKVQEELLCWLPTDEISLKKYGHEVIMLLLPAKQWQVGLQMLRGTSNGSLEHGSEQQPDSPEGTIQFASLEYSDSQAGPPGSQRMSL